MKTDIKAVVIGAEAALAALDRGIGILTLCRGLEREETWAMLMTFGPRWRRPSGGVVEITSACFGQVTWRDDKGLVAQSAPAFFAECEPAPEGT